MMEMVKLDAACIRRAYQARVQFKGGHMLLSHASRAAVSDYARCIAFGIFVALVLWFCLADSSASIHKVTQ